MKTTHLIVDEKDMTVLQESLDYVLCNFQFDDSPEHQDFVGRSKELYSYLWTMIREMADDDTQ